MLTGHGESVFELSFLNEFPEARRTGDVGALPDHEEVFVVGVIVVLGP